ncbi:MAG TPA: beta-ketoacyl-[acyl-carrier-protein] synthase family protein [Thermoanaerobaculia bacterium]|nr:beta-ketoacyl-[acyl-carrier-protein] synthase family protein [Thermoanaerobaculia bacterium]
MTRRVVVSGMGVIAPNGRSVGDFASALERGVSAVGPIRRFPTAAYPTRIAAEIDDFEWPGPGEPPRDWSVLDRIARFAAGAAAQAVDDAHLASLRGEKIGVLIAAGFGSYDHEEVFRSCAAGRRDGGFDWKKFRDEFRCAVKPRALERRTPGAVPALVARHFGFRGPVMAVMTACAAGTQALGDAARWIRRGDADVVVAGAADSELYPMGLASFCLLRALSKRNDEPQRASRPFSASRDGFVLGEGAAILILEELEHARARGATTYAEVLGFGSACDSFRVTDPHPDGAGAMLAMKRALDQAGLVPAGVDYINAHGTSTPLNDRVEARAIRSLFGEHAKRVAISSTKSMIGHLTVAAGAAEAVATVCALQRQIVHPTLNLDDPDPECDLDFVPHAARPMRVEVALSNSFAFGGQCASVALGRVARA